MVRIVPSRVRFSGEGSDDGFGFGFGFEWELIEAVEVVVLLM